MNWTVFGQTLLLMWQGMAAVFIVMMVIYIFVLALYIGAHKRSDPKNGTQKLK